MTTDAAEKCYDIGPYRPYNGAKSFGDIDNQMAVEEYAYSIDRQTSMLRGIIENITSDEEMSVDEKSAAITKAAGEYKSRINSVEQPSGMKSFFEGFKAFIKGGNKESVKEDSKKSPLEIPTIGGFKVYRDADGAYRWLSLSANAFEDRDKEIFRTKALEGAVEYADSTGERGPLLVHHVPNAVIGHCDYQGVAGRFLVESGTFDDTQLGKKALEHFINSEEDFQVSVGYRYKDGDEQDGVYEWMEVFERSVCSNGTAANPWTSFKVIGESPMNDAKAADLTKIFGSEIATKVISEAETKTKELEANTKFKTTDEPAFTEDDLRILFENTKSITDETARAAWQAKIVKANGGKSFEEKAAKPKMDDEDEDDEKMKGKKEATPETPTSVLSQDAVLELAKAIRDIGEAVTGLQAEVKTIKSEVKTIQKDDDERVAEAMTPRFGLNGFARPSESDNNVIDEKTMKGIKEAIEQTEEPEVNPAYRYAMDIIGKPVGA